ncbi:MAG: DMT family transporter [Pseudanabaenaceae cyanobacterium SKYGB_i_bin29]|nr:DMT family transporter [Pseudanabaenaceae cyanobacterium SKYG29]MDW8421593.1 DMT family transporter [Pseudanabaenaceae cyanobacterium SKYGB_i_bin29]
MTFLGDLRGQLAALSAAFLWAAVSIYYTRLGKQLSPLVLNLAKGIVALFLFAVTIVGRQESPPVVPWETWLFLALSGIAGIGIGDTAFFASLNAWGARRTLLMDSLSPGMTTVLSWLFLQEQLGTKHLLGIALAISGVAIVVGDRSAGKVDQTDQLRGLGYGLLFVLAQAIGVILSRAALAGSAISPLWSTTTRLTAGVAVLLVWTVVQQSAKPKWDRETVGGVVVAAFFSTYLGIWLQQTALKFAPAPIAQSLSSMGPVFILLIGWCLGETVNYRSWVGVACAVAGVVLLLQS